MKRRKKYNPKRHCEQLMAGARFIHDSRLGQAVQAVDRFGKDLDPMMLDYLDGRPWRWRIDATVTGRAGDLCRHQYLQEDTQQTHRMAELIELIDKFQTESMLEMPPSFKFDRIEWVARVI